MLILIMDFDFTSKDFKMNYQKKIMDGIRKGKWSKTIGILS
jgi:hypothetical protein